MNPQLENIPSKMIELGLSALAHANRHAAYYDPSSPNWHQMSVLQAAHAAEILIKARIAEEHPLLIFEKFPKITSTDISLEQLFSDGKTIEWSELPTRLWATAGVKLDNPDLFKHFGKLRNGIQHFGAIPNNINLCVETLRFIFKVIDPFIFKIWGLYAVNYDEDDDSAEHFPPVLINNEIEFLVPIEIAEFQEYWDVKWEELSPNYTREMKNRIQNTLKGVSL